MKRVLVTGSSGFIGGQLVAQLLASDVEVVATVRDAAKSPMLPAGITHATFDLADPQSLDCGALSGVECVYHLAARVHVMRPSPADQERFRLLNVRATEALARAAARAGVRRFVFVSSIKAVAERSSRPISPADEPGPEDAYGRSKLAAERAVAAVAAETGLEAAIVRPPLVYGPGVGANFRRLMSLVRRGVPLPFGAVANRRSLVNVWNLADLLVRLGSHPRGNGVWLISDGRDLSTQELIVQLSRAMGRRPRLWAMPASMLRNVGSLLGMGAEIARLTDSLQVDATLTCRSLDWSPPVSLDEGIARTVDWFLQQDGRA
jgi:nucleoside-diphosphate-sugar epimerase